MKYQGVRWTLGGVMVLVIAISQAICGWVGSGVYFRAVYPVLLLAGSSIFFWVGYQAWNHDESALADAQTPPEDPKETR